MERRASRWTLGLIALLCGGCIATPELTFQDPTPASTDGSGSEGGTSDATGPDAAGAQDASSSDVRDGGGPTAIPCTSPGPVPANITCLGTTPCVGRPKDCQGEHDSCKQNCTGEMPFCCVGKMGMTGCAATPAGC